jgi:U5 small nuclear ribonucleoprotein component
MSEGGAELPRSFVHFVLEPFYKIMAVSISEEKAQLSPILSRLGVYLNKKDYHMDIKPLVKLILRKLLGDLSCVIDSLVHCVPNAADSTATKVKHFYQGEDGHTLTKCDPKGPLSVSITKLFNNEAAQTFYAFGRVMSGTLKAGQMVKVLGENYTQEEEEDMIVKKATKLWLLQAGGRFRI